MLVLRGLKFFPTCFALLNGKTYSTGNVVPVRAKTSISFELDKADICISVPSIPISASSLRGGGGWRLRLGCGSGAESQEEVGEGMGTAVRGAGGRVGKGR